MDNYESVVKEFRNFADQKLDEHLSEINAKYQEWPITDNVVLPDSINSHLQMYLDELKTKCGELSQNNQDAQAFFSNLISEYKRKLITYKIDSL